MNYSKAIEKPFNGQVITFYKDEDAPIPELEGLWITGGQLGQALGYADPGDMYQAVYFPGGSFYHKPYHRIVEINNQWTWIFNGNGAYVMAVLTGNRQALDFLIKMQKYFRIPYEKKSSERKGNRFVGKIFFFIKKIFGY